MSAGVIIETEAIHTCAHSIGTQVINRTSISIVTRRGIKHAMVAADFVIRSHQTRFTLLRGYDDVVTTHSVACAVRGIERITKIALSNVANGAVATHIVAHAFSTAAVSQVHKVGHKWVHTVRGCDDALVARFRLSIVLRADARAVHILDHLNALADS